MCEHCGCREVEPIAELMDEHLALLEVSGDARRQLDGGDLSGCVQTLERLAGLLGRHVSREEQGVFAAMKEQGDFVDAVQELEAEHVSFDEALACLDPAAPGFADGVHALLAQLSDHIDNENLGIFPAATITLGARGWQTVVGAHEAEPSFLAVPVS